MSGTATCSPRNSPYSSIFGFHVPAVRRQPVHAQPHLGIVDGLISVTHRAWRASAPKLALADKSRWPVTVQ